MVNGGDVEFLGRAHGGEEKKNQLAGTIERGQEHKIVRESQGGYI